LFRVADADMPMEIRLFVMAVAALHCELVLAGMQ
jgi:hypothetical protein